MRQKRLTSLVEQVCNVGSGYLTGWALWAFVIPALFGIRTGLAMGAKITFVFTVVSVLRGYVWRRVFESFRDRQ